MFLTVIVSGFLIFMTGCRKEQNLAQNQATENTSMAKIRSDLREINQKYINHIGKEKTTRNWGRIGMTAGADLAGGVSAAASSVSLFGLGPIGGLAAGFITGIGAATASVGMHYAMGIMIADNGGNEGGITEVEIKERQLQIMWVTIQCLTLIAILGNL